MRSTSTRAPAVTIAVGLLIIVPAIVESHCDTLDGPVVTEARAALEAGDVTPLLKWVSSDYEAEIRSAFDQVAEVRELGGEARALADRYLFETLVRVHRAGEGAPYTGLKPAGSGAHEAEAAADAALAAGSVDELADRIGEQAAAGVRERFALVTETQEHVDESVDAGRRYVEAYVRYVHYVLGLHTAIAEAGAHGYGPEEQGSTHSAHGR